MSTSGRRSDLRLVLFVEGTSGPSLDGLWRELIPTLLGLPPFARVVGVSKHHLVAMSNKNMKLRYRTSTISVGLDEIIASELEKQVFDCAVVAWDLVPAWDSGSDPSACRWQDTLLLYEGLARSNRLPLPWREGAEQRLKELRLRSEPSRRTIVPRPAPNTVLSVCMEPEFEGMLLHEPGIKAVLGVKGRSIRGWPDTWNRRHGPRPSETLAKAIEAARRVRPKPAVFRKLHLSLREAKHEWGTFILRNATNGFRAEVLNHPVANRLKELLVPVAR